MQFLSDKKFRGVHWVISSHSYTKKKYSPMYSSSQGIRRCRVIESKLSDYKCFTIIFFTTRSFTIDSAFLRRPFRHFSTKTLLLLRLYSSVIYPPIFISFFSSAFQPINNITFVLFHDFREYCKHKFSSHDDSRLCCLFLYIFTILHFFLIFCLKNLIQ